jgi:hypothetical protein
MNLTILLVVVLLLVLVSGGWGVYTGGPYAPWYGGVGLLIALALVLLLMGYRL